MARVRYFVDDMDASIKFYSQLGFKVDMHPAPGFAAPTRDDLQLLLSTTENGGGSGAPMPDGRRPEPGGWNRFELVFDDLAEEVNHLKKAGMHFRNNIVHGIGGDQILLEDPSGNVIELFQPKQQPKQQAKQQSQRH